MINVDNLCQTLRVIQVQVQDSVDRNGLPVDHSPYKTRRELASRKFEHGQNIERQIEELINLIREQQDSQEG
jgi:ferritin